MFDSEGSWEVVETAAIGCRALLELCELLRKAMGPDGP
jgi:hypothetical protein